MNICVFRRQTGRKDTQNWLTKHALNLICPLCLCVRNSDWSAMLSNAKALPFQSIYYVSYYDFAKNYRHTAIQLPPRLFLERLPY